MRQGRYCETLGWLSMTGVNSSNYHSSAKPLGVPNPTRRAVAASTGTASINSSSSTAPSSMLYARRYLDWNRLTFAYHAVGSQDNTFDTHTGRVVTSQISADRQHLNLTALYGCAPRTYCQFCQPFGAPGNIFTLLSTALSTVVVNESRADIPRLIIINTGSIRFDLVQGPFTYDDSFIVSPFEDAFQFIPNVPYNLASVGVHLL